MSHSRTLLAATAIVLALACPYFPSLADPIPWKAKVLWTRTDRAYVVLEDSSSVAPGTRLTFEDRGHVVATGEVSAAHDGQLIVVVLTSGSLGKGEVARIGADPGGAATIQKPAVLRLGYPAPGRPSLLFACERVTPRPLARGPSTVSTR
jgi:hypothetical protein